MADLGNMFVSASDACLAQWTKQQGMDMRVLSDCNTTFISHMLSGAKADSLVSAVHSNPARFVRIDRQVSFNLARLKPSL